MMVFTVRKAVDTVPLGEATIEMIVSYELQFFVQNEWRIHQVFANRKEAEDGARDLMQLGTHDVVRVLEETFDEESGETRTHTVLRKSKYDHEALPHQSALQSRGQPPNPGPGPETATTKPKTPVSVAWVLGLMLKAAAVVGLGAALWYAFTTAMDLV